jgi:glycosyltransferase involved in cell wall biosynthesis
MTRKMRILSVVEATNVNAVAKVIFEFHRTARELDEASNELPHVEGSLVTFDRHSHQAENEFLRAARSAGIEIDVIPERSRFDFSVISALETIVAQRSPDIMLTHSVKSHFLMWRSRMWKQYPWIAFHHGYTTTDRKMRLYNRFDRWSLPKADLILTVCNAFARELAAVARVQPEKIRVQHNPIRPAPRPAAETVRAQRRQLGIAENEPVILSIGRLSNEKAHADLIAAFRQLRDTNAELNCKLVIVGDGPERDRLESFARQSGVAERIVFAGQVKDVQPYYAIASVFVLPSHSEGSPNVLLEAMAANVPVVATDVGGVPEIVQNEQSALLVPARDSTGLAEAIARVLADGELTKRLTNNAAKLVRDNHSPADYVQSLIRSFSKIRSDRDM